MTIKPATKYAILSGIRDHVLDELAVLLRRTTETELLADENLDLQDVQFIHASVNTVSDAIDSTTNGNT